MWSEQTLVHAWKKKSWPSMTWLMTSIDASCLTVKGRTYGHCHITQKSWRCRRSRLMSEFYVVLLVVMDTGRQGIPMIVVMWWVMDPEYFPQCSLYNLFNLNGKSDFFYNLKMKFTLLLDIFKLSFALP